MKYPYFLIALWCISCGSHQHPGTVKANPVADSANAISVDTNRSVKATPLHTYVFTTDLNNDSINDTIRLSSSTDDTTTFDAVSIAIAHFGRQTFHASEAWMTVDNDFLDSNKNAIATNKFFLAKSRNQCVLLLFGLQDGTGYRSDFSIINHYCPTKIGLKMAVALYR
jgi:hypothetical protein